MLSVTLKGGGGVSPYTEVEDSKVMLLAEVQSRMSGVKSSEKSTGGVTITWPADERALLNSSEGPPGERDENAMDCDSASRLPTATATALDSSKIVSGAVCDVTTQFTSGVEEASRDFTVLPTYPHPMITTFSGFSEQTETTKIGRTIRIPGAK